MSQCHGLQNIGLLFDMLRYFSYGQFLFKILVGIFQNLNEDFISHLDVLRYIRDKNMRYVFYRTQLHSKSEQI